MRRVCINEYLADSFPVHYAPVPGSQFKDYPRDNEMAKIAKLYIDYRLKIQDRPKEGDIIEVRHKFKTPDYLNTKESTLSPTVVQNSMTMRTRR